MVASLTAAAIVDPRTRIELFLLALAPGAAAYLAALGLVDRLGTPSRAVLGVCLALAVAARIPLLAAPPGLSDDVYRYVWEGRVQRYGYNPYITTPADPEMASLHTETTRRGDHLGVSTPYPPLTLLFFRAVTSIDESVGALKAGFLLCDLLIVAMVIAWLDARGRSRLWVLAYAWNPLVPLEGAGNAHADLLGVLWLVGAALALARGRPALAGLAFGLSVGSKLVSVVAAPLFIGRIRARDAALGAGVLIALYVPFLAPDGLRTGGLGLMLARWRTNGPIFAVIEPVVGTTVAVGVAVAAGLLVAALLRRRAPMQSDTWGWPIATSLVLAPVVYPWYLIWLTPFLDTARALPMRLWTLSVLPTYLVWRSWQDGLGWRLPGWVVGLEFAVVAAGAAWLLLRPPPAVPGDRSAR